MKKFLTSTGAVFLGLGIPVAVVFFGTFLIKGGVWLGDKILPWISLVAGWVLIVDLLILLPLGIFKKTRAFSGVGLFISSFAYGLTLWVWSLLLVYMIWGGISVFIGFFIMGIGNVPFAILATAIEGEWATTGQLGLLIALTYGARLLGLQFTKHTDF